MRRSQQAIELSKAALTKAEDEVDKGVEKVNNDRLSEAQEAKKKAAAARRQAAGEGAEEEEEEEEPEEVGEGDWERASEESLAKALAEAKEAVTHAESYLIGRLGGVGGVLLLLMMISLGEACVGHGVIAWAVCGWLLGWVGGWMSRVLLNIVVGSLT